MPAALDDQTLLAEARGGSRAALDQIVRHHIGFVYSAALRQVRQRELAEDVTQAVFVLLVRKVHSIPRGTILEGWLFNATRYTAMNALRMQARRTHHERQAASQMQRESPEQIAIQQIGPLLDEALAKLAGADREAIVMHYLCGQTLRTVGGAIGVSEEAARKRVSRAIVKLRQILAKRGVTVESATLGSVIVRVASAPLPAGLSQATMSALATPQAVAQTIGLLAKGANRMMFWTKAKLVACVAAVVLVGGSGAIYMTRAQPQPAPAPAAPVAKMHGAQLANGTIVQIVGVTSMTPPYPWWSADGTPIDPPLDAATQKGGISSPTHAVAIAVSDPPGSDCDHRINVKGVSGWGDYHGRRGGQVLPDVDIMTLEPTGKSVTVRVEVASGKWEIAARSQGTGVLGTGGPMGGVCFAPLSQNKKGNAMMTISHNMQNQQVRYTAIDKQNNEHAAQTLGGVSASSVSLSSMEFDVPPDEIKEVQVQARPYDRWVEIQDVTLDPAVKTDVRIISNGEAPP